VPLHVDQPRRGGKNHEVLRSRETGDHGGQCVVVAELDFGCTDRVVFVDDRDRVVVEELLEPFP